MECYLRNVQDLLAEGKTPYQRRFGEPFKGPMIAFLEQWLNTTPFQHEIIKTSSMWQESFTRNLCWVRIDRGEKLEKRHSDCRY